MCIRDRDGTLLASLLGSLAALGDRDLPPVHVLVPGPQEAAAVRALAAVTDPDLVVEGAHTATILHSAASADPHYNDVAVDSITVHIADNDTVGLAVSKLASVATANVGDAVVYTFRITNSGTVLLNNVSAVDDKLGTVALDATSLAP